VKSKISKIDIKTQFLAEHNYITKEHYIDKLTDLATFQVQHTAVWNNMQEALLASGFAETIWHYTLSATIKDVEVTINVDSPRQLSLTEKQTYLQALKDASWTLKSEVSTIVELP